MTFSNLNKYGIVWAIFSIIVISYSCHNTKNVTEIDSVVKEIDRIVNQYDHYPLTEDERENALDSLILYVSSMYGMNVSSMADMQYTLYDQESLVCTKQIQYMLNDQYVPIYINTIVPCTNLKQISLNETDTYSISGQFNSFEWDDEKIFISDTINIILVVDNLELRKISI